jgi:rod shape-determining protein MreC
VLAFLKRHRDVLLIAFLLLYPGVALLTSAQRARSLNVVDRSVLALSAPLQSGLRAAIDGATSLWSHYVSLRGLQRDNEVLKRDNASLRGEVTELAEARAENVRLKRMVGFVEANPGIRVPARVVGVAPDVLRQWVTVDRGEQDGVKVGWAVVTPDGVVGQVTRTLAAASYVMLLTDSNSRIGVRVQRTRSRATVSGSGEPTLRLDNAVRSEALEEDDLLVTSGTDGVYPPGLSVGHVSGVGSKGGMFWSARVSPSVDTTKLEEVFVLPSPLPGGVSGPLAWPGSSTGKGALPR